MDKLLIHIGYHKTGSSWLQRHLFSASNQAFAAPLHRRDDVFQQIVMPNGLDFRSDRCRQALAPRLRDAAAGPRVPVISAERLSGSPYSGGYDSKELANRLQAVFPEARILIVIREQVSMLVSTYKAYVDKGGMCSLREFFSPPARARGRIPWFDAAHFSYHRLIEHYHELFGPSRVLVLAFEQLRNDPLEFTHEIVRFAGAERNAGSHSERQVNPGIDASIIGLRRRLNPLLVRDPLNGYSPAQIPGLDRFFRAAQMLSGKLLPDNIEKRCQEKLESVAMRLIGEFYHQSNSRTGKLTGLVLSDYGYALPTTDAR